MLTIRGNQLLAHQFLSHTGLVITKREGSVPAAFLNLDNISEE